MKSTDHNINDPNSIGPIPSHRYMENWEIIGVEYMTSEQYTLMNIHDPCTMYIITDAFPQQAYIGDIHINSCSKPNSYYMTTNYISELSKYEYIIYMNTRDGIYNSDNLIEICRFKDPQAAIDALNLYNGVGTHTMPAIQIMKILRNYIEGNISIHDCMIGIMSACGYMNHPGMQYIIQISVIHRLKATDRDLPITLREEIKYRREHEGYRSLIGIYADVYDVFVKYDFFKDKQYSFVIGTPNAVGIISDFMKVIMNPAHIPTV